MDNYFYFYLNFNIFFCLKFEDLLSKVGQNIMILLIFYTFE